jgi:hypothetical protein
MSSAVVKSACPWLSVLAQTGLSFDLSTASGKQAKAKKSISDYRKAIGLQAGVAELSVFYCERAARLLSECGMEDERYLTALVRMFDQALDVVAKLNPSERRTLLQRLDAVRSATDAVGWGVKDAMDELWAERVWED